MGDYRLTRSAGSQLTDILDWSEEKFHETGRARYASLLVQAMEDLADDPEREGVERVRTLGMRLSVYHIWHSRNNIADPTEHVHEPRHLIVFSVAHDGGVDVLGFIHDSMLRGRALRRVVRANAPDLH